MPEPLFSIVIPTRLRPETLRWSIRTALQQNVPADEFEVIVQDNASDPSTRAVVESLAAPNLIYSRSDTPLAMSDNWEMALQRCRGEFITYIGDDDGMMPFACQVAGRVIQQQPNLELMTWSPFSYWWPDCILPHQKNRLYFRNCSPDRVYVDDARTLEKYFFNFDREWDVLPMIYNSWVRRSLISKVQAKTGGRYFPSIAPDIFSGMANLWGLNKVLWLDLPLCMRGTSGQSAGVAKLYPQLAPAVAARFERESESGRPYHPDLIPSNQISILLANEMCIAHQIFHQDRPELKLNPERVVRHLLAMTTQNPDTRDVLIADARALAAKHGMDFSTFEIPALRPWPKTGQGPVFDGQQFTDVVVNCAIAGVSNIFDAVQLASAMLT